MIYHAYVHSTLTYGIIFKGNSPQSTYIFKIQKRIIRIMTKSGRTDSCRQLFKRLRILPLKSQYILSTLLFVVKNNDLFTMNEDIRYINTRSNTNLHPPLCKLTLFQKDVYFTGIKLYNHLPHKLKKSLKRDTDVQTSLKKISLLPLILFNGGVSRLQTQLSIRTLYYNVFIDILNQGHKETMRGLISRSFL